MVRDGENDKELSEKRAFDLIRRAFVVAILHRITPDKFVYEALNYVLSFQGGDEQLTPDMTITIEDCLREAFEVILPTENEQGEGNELDG